MTADALAVVQVLFGTIWRLFTSWRIPGTHTTPAAFICYMLVCGLALRFVQRLFSISSSDDNPDGKPDNK